jgi:acyl carrier protein
MTARSILPDAVHQRAILWAQVSYIIMTLHPEMAISRIIVGQTSLTDLGCDEIDVVAIIMELEMQLGRDLPTTIITGGMTVRQCADALLAITTENEK